MIMAFRNDIMKLKRSFITIFSPEKKIFSDVSPDCPPMSLEGHSGFLNG